MYVTHLVIVLHGTKMVLMCQYAVESLLTSASITCMTYVKQIQKSYLRKRYEHQQKSHGVTFCV